MQQNVCVSDRDCLLVSELGGLVRNVAFLVKAIFLLCFKLVSCHRMHSKPYACMCVYLRVVIWLVIHVNIAPFYICFSQRRTTTNSNSHLAWPGATAQPHPPSHSGAARVCCSEQVAEWSHARCTHAGSPHPCHYQ